MSDALERLAQTLYGRGPTPKEYIGGSQAKILDDAQTRIEELKAVANSAKLFVDGWREQWGKAEAERERYRKALEDAPIPNFAGFHDGTYADWYTGERKKALEGQN